MLAALAGIATIVVLISGFKVHAFLAMIIGSGVVGLASGLHAPDVVKQFETGFGNTLASVGSAYLIGKRLLAALSPATDRTARAAAAPPPS